MNTPQISITSYEDEEAFEHNIVSSALSELNPQHKLQTYITLTSKQDYLTKEFVDDLSNKISSTGFYPTNIFLDYGKDPVVKILTKNLSSGCVLLVSHEASRIIYQLYGNEISKLHSYAEILNPLLSSAASNEANAIKFVFWHRDSHGEAFNHTNENVCPNLSEIEDNYPTTLHQIKYLTNIEDPYSHGKIIIWTGDPGNGKTHLIRALSKHWATKYNIIPEVIIDPENLFDDTGYLTDLLLTGMRRVYKNNTPKFRLIIAEDCADLFSVNCRNKTGFGRLLNSVDGLLGQGQRLIFLFTANEAIGQVDPAILRPGRCLQQLEIPNWNLEDSKKWLEKHGAGEHLEELNKENSLAELYAILNNTKRSTKPIEKFGFNL